MIRETFIASDPKTAYEQAVKKYGNNLTLLSARQLQYDDGKLRCEIEIVAPKALYMEKTLQKKDLQNEEEEMLRNQVEKLTQEIQILKETHKTDTQEMAEVREVFLSRGISNKWLDATLNPLRGSGMDGDAALLLSYCLEEIDDTLTLKEESIEEECTIVLVGPTGVGKTTTLAKLAARYAYLMDRPYKVAIVNLDNYKVGAIEQLKYYATILSLEYFVVESPEAFEALQPVLDAFEIVLIDTAGMSPYDTQKFIDMVAYIHSEQQKKIEVQLVIAATMKYEDIEDVYQSFSFLNIDSVIISKLDETMHLGTLMNFALNYQTKMSYFSTGQEVPDDLVVADKEYLLERFLGNTESM